MKKKVGKLANEYKLIIITNAIFLIIISCYVGLIYKCSHNENYLYYGDNDYTFANVVVGSGRTESFYCGAIKIEDYQRWCNGENGTMFVYSPTKENYGYRISIPQITTINYYGSTPDWLPIKFYW